MKILITGGAGFIGSNFIRYWLEEHPEDEVVNLDKLTYAGHLSSTKDFLQNPHYQFIQGDICDQEIVNKAMAGVDTVVHFAAESHADRSLVDPSPFTKTNVVGTGVLLGMAMKGKVKRFHHVSTDEVFGQLSPQDPPFNEDTKFAPRTPYSSTKAGSDLLAQSFFESFGLPLTITNCVNNFGPFHDPEKLIPRFITNLLTDKKVPLMGKGENIRSWLYVEDHCRAIECVINNGKIGERYCVGGPERTNLEVTQKLLQLLGKDESWVEYVEHRLGHDFRYAVDDHKIRELGWQPLYDFDEQLEKTVNWYANNKWWWEPLLKESRPVVDRVAQKSYSSAS